MIKDEGGRFCETKEDIEAAFIAYFSNLFKAGSDLDIEGCLGALDCKVTTEMNQLLLADITMEDITVALQQMAPLKAPGPNGYSTSFYHQNWAIIHNEVCSVVLHFFHSGSLDRAINKTHIALIPKKEHPESVSDFRPISLCNVLYKLISKVLANRLKLVLLDIISCTQSAFIPGRLITYNILAAFETLHTVQTRMWSKMDSMGFKLDMSKAYDRIEWPFLEAVMKRLGFAKQWIWWIMVCVRSVSYSILINRCPVGDIQPSRGIRQGNPISPYLFLLCGEAFSALLLCKYLTK
jgi:hypothetical protein